MLRWPDADIALVSHGIPPGRSGFHLMLDQLLGAIPQHRLATVGIGGPWGNRANVPFPAGKNLPGREALLVSAAVAATEVVAPFVYPRMLPAIRKIFATLDPTLGVATRWAKRIGAELWIYAIDLHADGYWAKTALLQNRLLAWRGEALRGATRVLAISDLMADWLRSKGAVGDIQVVPPLYPVGEPAPAPEGPLTFLMSGVIYTVNAGPLRWLEKAVKELAPAARLRLVTPSEESEIRRHGLDPAAWSVASREPKDVPAEVAASSWGVVGIDSGQSLAGERVAWPTKLREFLSLGRPVLCITRPDYGLAKMAASSRWAIVAYGEAETRAAVARIAVESRAEWQERSAAAHAFARANIDDASIGAEIRRQLCA